MSQKYVEIWEASKSSRNVLNIGICWQLKVYTWIFLIGFGYLGVLNTDYIIANVRWLTDLSGRLIRLLSAFIRFDKFQLHTNQH